MKASTAGPAFTNIITLLGFFNVATISFMDLAPITFVPEKDNFLVLQQYSMDARIFKFASQNIQFRVVKIIKSSTSAFVFSGT